MYRMSIAAIMSPTKQEAPTREVRASFAQRPAEEAMPQETAITKAPCKKEAFAASLLLLCSQSGAVSTIPTRSKIHIGMAAMYKSA